MSAFYDDLLRAVRPDRPTAVAAPPAASLEPPPPPRVLSPAQTILVAVCEKHGVSKAALTGPRRHRTVAAARHEAAYRLRHELGLSLLQIARLFKRHHTTILNSIERHADTLAREARRGPH